jgi:hypothetical protein
MCWLIESSEVNVLSQPVHLYCPDFFSDTGVVGGAVGVPFGVLAGFAPLSVGVFGVSLATGVACPPFTPFFPPEPDAGLGEASVLDFFSTILVAGSAAALFFSALGASAFSSTSSDSSDSYSSSS